MPGQNAQLFYGLEHSEGVPWHDRIFTPFESESFVMDRPTEASPNIDGSGTETRGDNLEATGSGSLAVHPNSEDLLAIRAHQRGWYEIATPAAGVKRWTIRRRDPVEDAAIAHYLDSMHFGIWRDQRDDPSLYKAYGAKCSQLVIGADAQSHAIFTHDFLYLRDTYSRAVQQAVNAAFTGEVFPRGHRILGDEGGDYFKLKIVDPGALGVATGVWGLGAAAYGATEHTIFAVMDVLNDDDSLYATREEPYQIVWAIPAGSLFTADDEFRFYPTEAKPVAVLSARPRFNTNKCDITIVVDGEELTTFRPYNSIGLTIATPREAIPSVGSKYGQTIDVPNEAKEYCEFTFNSIYFDRKFEQALISAAEVDAVVTFYGGQIGTTGFEDYAKFTFDGAWITAGGTGGVQNAGRLPETVTMRAGTCVEEWQNTVASIAQTA